MKKYIVTLEQNEINALRLTFGECSGMRGLGEIVYNMYNF